MNHIEQRRLKRRMAYIGRLHSYKGLEHIFELAGHLKTANIELHSFGGNEAQVLSLQERADYLSATNASYSRSCEPHWRLRAKRILDFFEGMFIAILSVVEHDLYVVAEIEYGFNA